jgi:hypothetical protein
MGDIPLDDCIGLYNSLAKLKRSGIRLYNRAQQLGFPECSRPDCPREEVAPAIGDCMCLMDEAMGHLRAYIDEVYPGQVEGGPRAITENDLPTWWGRA